MIDYTGIGISYDRVLKKKKLKVFLQQMDNMEMSR